jgi:hypothetical protein
MMSYQYINIIYVEWQMFRRYTIVEIIFIELLTCMQKFNITISQFCVVF